MKESLNQRIQRQKNKNKNINNYLEKNNNLIDELYNEIIKWREVSNCTVPVHLKTKLNNLEKKAEKNDTNNFKNEIKNWQQATKCKTPDEANLLFISLQNDDFKEMYNDPLCKMYMWNFEDKSVWAETDFQTLDDFNYALNNFIKIIYDNTNNISDIIYLDSYNFIGFFKFLYDINYTTSKINLKEICEEILYEQ